MKDTASQNALGLINNLGADLEKEENFIEQAIALQRNQRKKQSEVIEEENIALKARRVKMFGETEGAATLEESKFGIAFSGGGIRSASICLGGVKILSKLGILQKADYISSVSGGGYTNAYVQATLLQDNLDVVKVMYVAFLENKIVTLTKEEQDFLRDKKLEEQKKAAILKKKDFKLYIKEQLKQYIVEQFEDFENKDFVEYIRQEAFNEFETNDFLEYIADKFEDSSQIQLKFLKFMRQRFLENTPSKEYKHKLSLNLLCEYLQKKYKKESCKFEQYRIKEQYEKLADDDFIEQMKSGGADYLAAPSKVIPSKLLSFFNILGIILIGLVNPIILFFSVVLVWFMVSNFLIDSINLEGGIDFGAYLGQVIYPLGLLAFISWIAGTIGYSFFGTTLRLNTFQTINKLSIYFLGFMLIALLLNYSGAWIKKLEEISTKWIIELNSISTKWTGELANFYISVDNIWMALKFMAIFFILSRITLWMLNDRIKNSSFYQWYISLRSYKLFTTIATLLIVLLLVMLVFRTDPESHNLFAFRLLCLFILMGFFTNINLISFGRIYGDSLTKAFNFDKSISLGDLNKTFIAPYPLFNCCLNLSAQAGIKSTNLTADYFLLSPKYIGSRSTDYIKDNGNLSLSRAMATSAAAINTGMGTFSIGIASILIGLLNFRMGALLYNPKNHLNFDPLTKDWASSNIFVKLKSVVKLIVSFFSRSLIWWPRYYLRSLFATNSLDNNLLDISDGGHIENLGVIELLRRRCKLIIGMDAGMDANYAFEDLKILIRRAWHEQGIELKFREDFNKIIKPSDRGFSEKRYAIADILLHKEVIKDAAGEKVIQEYKPAKEIGTYIYIKSALSEKDLIPFQERKPAEKEGALAYLKSGILEKDAPLVLKNEGVAQNEETEKDALKKAVSKYKSFNAAFPHHSTSNQSFEPIQFLAYFQLGQELYADLFGIEDIENIDQEKHLTREQIMNTFKKNP